jgi:alpha-D-xyloside xylohydrolase
LKLSTLVIQAGLLVALALSAQRAIAGLNSNSTVFVILMENHNWSSIKGSANAPYINNTLLPMASYCDQYYTPPGNHPSLPNYLWLEAGTNFGILNDNPPSSNHQSTTAHFVTQLQNAGISWKAYEEDINGTTCPTTDSGNYAVRHDPFVYFDDVVNSDCTSVVRPFTELASDIANNTLAHYNFITPNVCDDMHDSCAPTSNPVKQGDDWLAANVPMILNSSAYQNNGLLVIVWDEGGGGSDGPIGCIVLSPLAKGGGYHSTVRYTHGSLLRTWEKIFGVTPLAGAGIAPDLGDLFNSGAIPNADPNPVVAPTTEVGGVAVLEAENFEANIPRSGYQWTLNSSVAEFSGTGYMEALPNNGANMTSAGDTTPELQFTVNFANTGTHYIWIRGYAAANTDDSIHVGIDGGSAAAMTLSQYSTWQWSNTLTAGGTATLSVGSTGNHIINVWMREDGMRIDRVLLTTNPTFSPTIGNAWHIPNSTEGGVLPGGATMRSPLSVPMGTNVTVYNGNQFQGSGGNPGNQLQTGSTVYYKRSTDSTWSSVAMTFSTQNGNNKYFYATIPSGTFNGGDLIQYYFKIPYSDHLPTFLYGNDSQSNATELESVAQASPFAFSIKPPLTPPGGTSYHSVTSSSGSFQARIYDTGHLELAEPDLSGNPFANVITFAPPSATINGISYDFGPVQSVTNIPNGIQVTQLLAGTTITAQLTFTPDGVMHYEVTDWNGLTPTETDITAASDSTEHVYGFGEKFNALDQSGNRVHIMTSDIGGDKNDYSYKSSSWFISTRGYGFHLDSTAESYFDMRNSAPDRYTIQNLFGTLKFNVVPGPKLTDVLTRYTGITGRPYLPPPWVFGTWISSDIWRTGGEVRYAITKYRDSGIPFSVFVFDSPWEVSYNDFTWNMTQFGAGGTYEGTTSHPSATYDGFTSVADMMTFFQQNGVKVICWFTPFINTSSFQDNVGGAIPGQNTGKSPNYDFAANNYFVRSSANGPPLVDGWWKGTGSPIDFTNAAAKNWFTTTQLQPLINGSNVVTANSSLEPAIGGFKTDDGEAVNSGGTYIPTTAVYSDGRTGLEMQNGYSIEYHKTVSGVLGANGILFARSGFNGTGAFPAAWPGDNQPNYTQTNGLQSVITAGDSAAMSGYSIWGHDIGAYQNGPFTNDRADLFMRWTQYGAFSPIMQMHRQVDPNNYEQYPWGYGATALANYVTYAKLHSQLFPYIYTYAKEASMDGLPIIRPEVLMNQTDSGTYGIQHTYYFGNELLVAPMNAADSTSRIVYLPAGDWYDFWTNAKYTGGQNLFWSNADTTKIPLFVRENSIIPMLANVPQSLNTANYVNNPAITTMDSGLQFLVYPGPAMASFNVYDGTSAQCSVNGTVTTLSLSSLSRAVTFKIFADSSPAGVEHDGIRLPKFTTQNDFNSADIGWFYDGTGKFLYVKFSHGGGNATVTFGPDSVGDGATDSWRSYWGISDDNVDTDGDGQTNLQEYFAGTNPNDPQSNFAIQSVTGQGNAFLVSWESQAGIVYRVQWKNALTDPGWQSITPDFTGTGSIMNWSDDGSQTGGFPAMARFYRVTIP